MKSRNSIGERVLLSGNEAFAQGAYEAGVTVASGYPGTPSTEILENLSAYEGIYSEWAPNEKVALEVALGASFAGARALATMKHVGLNVAADPLFTASYTGVKGGLVIINADDPDMHSSQNEQDNRNYAYAAKVPMLEPSGAEEAKEFVKIAYRISEEFDTPVIVRSTTRVSHVKGIITIGEQERSSATLGIEKMPEKFVMLPGHARKRRVEVEKRTNRLKEFAETFPENRLEWGDKKRGFIAAGLSYLYVKEAFPEASVLKLGMAYPFPDKMIRDFAAQVEELIVVEELDAFTENHVKALGISCKGKELIPAIGELNSFIVKKSVTGKPPRQLFEPVQIPLRPPNLCAGCPHRGIFHALSKLKVFVSGDIGCYTLAALKPLSAMDACVCMGASINMAFGMEKALGKESQGKIVSVIGDSTFMHTGINGLMNVVYNQGFSTIIILDNRTTGMTGHQPNPATGMTLSGLPTPEINIETLCRAIGVKHVVTLNPHQHEDAEKVLRQELDRPEVSVIVTKAPCALLPEMKKRRDKKIHKTIEANCTGCRACLRIGCPAIEWVPMTPEQAKEAGYKETQKGHSHINTVTCDGCGQCLPLCKFKAIVVEGETNG